MRAYHLPDRITEPGAGLDKFTCCGVDNKDSVGVRHRDAGIGATSGMGGPSHERRSHQYDDNPEGRLFFHAGAPYSSGRSPKTAFTNS